MKSTVIHRTVKAWNATIHAAVGYGFISPWDPVQLDGLSIYTGELAFLSIAPETAAASPTIIYQLELWLPADGHKLAGATSLSNVHTPSNKDIWFGPFRCWTPNESKTCLYRVTPPTHLTPPHRSHPPHLCHYLTIHNGRPGRDYREPVSSLISPPAHWIDDCSGMQSNGRTQRFETRGRERFDETEQREAEKARSIMPTPVYSLNI